MQGRSKMVETFQIQTLCTRCEALYCTHLQSRKMNLVLAHEKMVVRNDICLRFDPIFLWRRRLNVILFTSLQSATSGLFCMPCRCCQLTTAKWNTPSPCITLSPASDPGRWWACTIQGPAVACAMIRLGKN